MVFHQPTIGQFPGQKLADFPNPSDQLLLTAFLQHLAETSLIDLSILMKILFSTFQ